MSSGNLINNTERISNSSDIKMSGFQEDITLEEKTNISLPEEQLKKKRIKHGIINIVGLIIQKIGFGILASITYLSIYYVTYLSFKDKTIKLENAITLSSIYTLAECSSIWTGGVLKKFIHIRFIVIIGGYLYILASFGIMLSHTLLGYKFMMVLFGLGQGIQEVILIANACAYIPEKKGFINGLSKIFWTLSSSLFNYIGLHIVNPEGKEIELYHDNGLSKNIITYTIIIIICFSIVSIGSMLLLIPYNDKEYEKLKNQEEKENNNEDNNINIKEENKEDKNDNDSNEKEEKKTMIENKKEKEINIDINDDISFFTFFKCFRFYTCLLMYSFKNIHSNLVISSFSVFAIHYNTVTPDTQKYITSASFIVNFIAITILSFIIDKFKYRTIVIPSNLLNLCHALTFRFILRNKILYIIYYFMSGIFNSIEIVATFPHLLKVFGHKNIVIILGIFCIGTGLCDFGMNNFVDFILSRYNEAQVNEYDRAVKFLFYITSCFISISLVCMTCENENSVLTWMIMKTR